MMSLNTEHQQGFTYLLLLIVLTVMSVFLLKSREGQEMSFRAQQESELLFRGEQIRSAIASYREKSGVSGCFPVSFEQLLIDKRGLTPSYHLRQFYPDPLTGKKTWGMIYDAKGRWIGVYSLGTGIPRRKSGFLSDSEKFKKATRYRDWAFQVEGDPLAPLPTVCR
ncbi:type II secretion system protein [Enterobacter sp. RHBSTW-00994]|uniref:type II secretion system protein n=1 Tax=Enterobacter sp. RHBSTW-00994 TaxID=2742676 RepID=UPI0015EA26B2|nr:type II secretion system protein [Enterobacter sp. RHBSTW-00994]QLR43345.1 type II secretion system protein [Enterobacter sp. RHBSTW-00994]